MKEAWCLVHQGRVIPKRRITWSAIILFLIIPPFQPVGILALAGFFRKCPICNGKRFRNVTEEEKQEKGQLGRVEVR
jgi:hypothetical protein